MAESGGQDKTEPASERRLKQARENGDIPRSREVATFVVLMTAGAGLWMLGGGLIDKLSITLQRGLSLDREQIYNPGVLVERVFADIVGVMLACLPLAGVIMLMMLASPLAIGGWNFSA